MFFLTARTNEGRLCTIHVRGFLDKLRMGLVVGEGIFEVKQTSNAENQEVTLHVVRQLGVVGFQDDHFVFIFTDPEFKKSINYKENTGFSNLDGAPWQVHITNYINSGGNIAGQLQPTYFPQFMYTSAKNPFNKLPSMETLFSKKDVVYFDFDKTNKTATQNQNAEQKTSPRPK